MDAPQLFFVDVPPTASTSAAQAPHSPGSAAGSSIAGDSDSDEEAATATKAKALVKSRNLRQAAWHDPADENLQISLQGQKRLRKLRDSAAEDVVSGLEYESRLRRQFVLLSSSKWSAWYVTDHAPCDRFEKLHPPPQWAVDARRKILRRRAAQAQHGGNAALLVDSDVSDASDDGEEGAGSADERDEADELFSRAVVGGKGGKKVKGGKLEPGEIDIDRVRDANQHEQGSVRSRSLSLDLLSHRR